MWTCIFAATASCSGKYDEKEEALFIENLYKGDFSKAVNPDNKILKKMHNTNSAMIYFTGMYLKKEAPLSAEKYFQYAKKNSPEPYNLLAEKELYAFFDTDQKISELKKELAAENQSIENKKHILEKLNRLLFLTGTFEQMDIKVPEYLASIKLDEEIVKSLQKILLENEKPFSQDFYAVMEIRLLVFKTKFKDAWIKAKTFLQYIGKNPYLSNRIILSDIFRSALYGSANYGEDLKLFEDLLSSLEKKNDNSVKSEKYMTAFYTARLCQKAGGKDNIKKADEYFKKAVLYSTSPNDYDNALWYRLEILKNRSFKLFFEELCNTASFWKNAYVYENFVSYLIVHFTGTKNLKDFKRLYNVLVKTNLVELTARAAYILARMEHEKENANSKKLYNEALELKHNVFYYRIMTGYRAGVPLNLEDLYGKKKLRNAGLQLTSVQAVEVLNGFLKYKLYGEVYGKILELYPDIDTETASVYSSALAEKELYADSMKVITYAISSKGSEITPECLKLMYPRPWLSSVQKYCVQYNLPEYLLFALLRSESYFKPAVISRAGAVGLAQLMKPTAAGIAKQLKISDYNLNNPDTNIMFGAYYISDMIKRNGGKIMPALCSYNAGPNAVKRWKKQFGNMSIDLFLESLPYAETRGYGRNLLTASVIYGMLYYGKTADQVVEEIFSEQLTTSPKNVGELKIPHE